MDIRRGDIFFVKNPNKDGSEQCGDRPAIIVSNDMNNKHSPVVEVVFMTTKPKNKLPTHVNIKTPKESIALCEQIHSISKTKLIDMCGSCSYSEMEMIDDALKISLGIA